MKRMPHLMAPGPTPLPPEVLQALALPAIHHRGAPFKAIMQGLQTALQAMLQTQQTVLTLTASGTGVMEAAVVNLLARGDKGICINGGKFGERWGDLLRAYGCVPVEVVVEWGQAPTVAMIQAALDAHPDARAVFLQASETSTATSFPLEAIARLVRSQDGKRDTDLLLVVDGITAVGVDDIPFDAWGIDALCAASQKAFMCPPGLGFLALSERAWAATQRSDLPKFYFDLARERKSQKTGVTTWTPATALVMAVDAALKLILDEGLAKTFARHARLAAAMRAGVQALGMTLLSSSPANCATAFAPPPHVDAEALRKAVLKHQNLFMAGGQDHLTGKIIRVGHLGYFQDADIIATIGALEVELARLGHANDVGAGTRAVAASLIGQGRTAP